MRLSRARRLLSREHKPHRGEDGLPRCVQCVWAREELPAEDGGQRGRRGASEVGDAGGEVAGASWAAAFPLGKVGRCEQVLRRSGWCLEHSPDCPVRKCYRTGVSEGKPPRLSALVQVDARLDSQPGPVPAGAPAGARPLPSPCAAAGWAGSPPACPAPCGRTRWPMRLRGRGRPETRRSPHVSIPRVPGEDRTRGGADTLGPARRGGSALTLRLQLGQDGLRPADGGRREGLHAFFRRVTDGLDVGVALLGGGVGRRHHVTGGADKGHLGHAIHHAGLRESRS